MDLREKSESEEQLNKDVTLNSESANNVDNDAETKSEAQASEVENVAEESEVDEKVATGYSGKTKAELVAALEELLEKPVESIKDDVAQIKVAFYSLRNAEIAKLREEFLAKGNEESAFAVPDDAEETAFKDALNKIKEKRAEFNAAQDAMRAENLEKKRNIIAEINAIVADPDNINKQYARVQQLQQDFKAVGEIPATEITDIWKSYQLATENFYDLLKMNKELRDYDFKKNLEIKQQLCNEATALGECEDVVAAFKKLQELHNIWRETGPVAKEIREELWATFKDASAVVNKKYQAFFESRKEKEKENEVAKTAICEKVEAIDIAEIKTYAAWDDATKQIIELQEEWKKLGFAAKKVNADLFARFRKTCDEFFARKAEFFKTMKEELAANLQKKQALCEKAEALKDSTEWKKTADELVALQKEWKTVGPVAKKYSDVVWKRFIAACDHFFNEKNKQTSSVRQVEHANLKAKKEIIAGINTILAEASDTSDAATKVRAFMKQWQEIGHVPFKEKDKIYNEYREAVDKAFEKFDMKATRANLANFESSINQISDQDKMYRERERLVRSYELKRNELKTYENNMGFFNAQSKGGNSMLKEMERKIQKIKDELALLEKKIQLVDGKL